MRHLIASLVALSLSATACSADVAQSEVATRSDGADSAVSTVAPSGTAESRESRDPDDISLDTSWRHSAGSLVRNCPSRIGDDYGQGPVELPEPSIFDPVTGELVDIEPPLIPGGAELLEAGCLPSGTAEAPGVSIRMYLRTPSKGLDPESFKSLVYTYSVASPEDPVVATLDFPTDTEVTQGFMAGTGGNLLYAPGDGGLRLITPDGTLVKNFAASFYGVEYVDEHVFVISGTEKRDFSSFTVQQGFDGVTGEPVDFASGEGDFVGTWFGGFTFADTSGTPAVTRTTVVDTAARQAYDVGEIWDPLLWAPYAATASPNLSVIDLETGETVLERTEEQTRGLGITGLRLSGDYLYVQNEEDSPVIDLTTGEQVSSGWRLRPTEPVSSDWMVVAPFEEGSWLMECFHERALPNRTGGMYSLGDNFKCQQGATLVYSPEGYDGPWF